jgi:hypothetical protein
MYYGMEGFGLEDLAMSEMGQTPPAVGANDMSTLTQDAQQAAQLAAQYMVAKNPTLQPTLQPFLPKPPAPPPAPGMSPGMKLALGIGIGAAAVGALIWFAKRKKSSNKGYSKPNDDDWRSIGD